MTDIFQIAKLKIKKSLKILSHEDKIELKQFNKDYPFSKRLKVKLLISHFEVYSKINKLKAWQSIESKIQEQNTVTIYRLFNKKRFKYIAAALLFGLLTTSYFFKNKWFNNSAVISPATVSKNIIVPGTNKAVLTLEDGSCVVLENGSPLSTKNANSDGEKIVYNRSGSNDSKISFNYLTIPRGGQFHLVLADQTEVWLNSESQLKFPVSFIEGYDRKVELVYGEAYFDVSPSNYHKGSKFKVQNKSHEIEVLGTEFNIKAYKDEVNIYTTLVEGKVSIKTGTSIKVLKPSEQSRFNIETKTINISVINVYSEICWKDGVFSFKGKNLKEIMKVLSRWYDVEIIFENKRLETLKFKGTLNKNQSISEILSIMKSSSINNYEIKDKTIILK